MNVQEFMEEFDDIVRKDKNSFIENLKDKEFSFCEWVEVLFGWMEFHKDDCEEFYGE